MHNRVVVQTFQRTFWTGWVSPVGTGRPCPPLREVAEMHRSRRHPEDQRSRHQVLSRRTGIHQRIWSLFRLRDIADVVNKCAELGVGYLIAVDPETSD